MPERDWRFRLQDMLDCINKIERYTSGLTKDEFIGNDLVVDATFRNIEIIGEAARHIPVDKKEKLAMIAWSRIRGMRNKLAHDYPSIDLEIVWATVKVRLPELKAQLEQALKTLE